MCGVVYTCVVWCIHVWYALHSANCGYLGVQVVCCVHVCMVVYMLCGVYGVCVLCGVYGVCVHMHTHYIHHITCTHAPYTCTPHNMLCCVYVVCIYVCGVCEISM